MIKQGPIIEFSNSDLIKIEPGRAKAILPEERSKDYYGWTNGALPYKIALEERITLPYQNKLLVVRKGDGSIKFDDRKLRFSGYTRIRDNEYLLRIGPTHFGEIKETDIKAAMDENYEKYLLTKGMNDFNDPMAYFACSVAVNNVPITREGYVHIFRRSDSQELFPGRWDVTGGFVDVGDRIFNLHQGSMTKKFMSLVYDATRKELSEEAGSEHNKFELTGLVKGANYVFTHRSFLDISSEEYITRLGTAVDASESGNHLTLKSKEELVRFLETEKHNSTPTGYHALEFHLNRLVA